MNIQLPDTQLNVLISKDAVHEEEMMVSNFVKLTWNDATRYALPVGSYIVYGGVKYRLFDEYQPDASGERTYKYAPQFEHPTMWLKHIPFLRIELDGTKRSEWSFSGYVRDLGAYLLNFLITWGNDVDTEFGTDFNPSAFVSNVVQYSGGIGDMIINISFSAVDVWSALTQIAGQLDCEFHVDLAAHKLYIGTIATGTSETLTVGENVGVPSISRNKEAYCNRYVVHGGTRNLTQQGADGTNYQSTNRLTLPDNFTDSVINLKASNKPEGISQADWNAIKADQNEPSITGELVMDDIYPQVKFYLYDLKQRLRKRLLENGTESSETYATWYTKLAIRNGDNFTTYKMQDSVIATVVSNGTNSYGQQYIILNMAFGSGSQFTRGMLRPGFDEREYGLYWVEISDGTNKELAQVSPHGGGTLTKCIFQVESLIYQNATTGTEITFIGGIDITKAPKNNIHSDRIAGVTLQCSFLPNYATGALDSPLTGRTFDIVTFNHSGTEHDNEDVDAQGQASQGMAFDDETFRIEPVDENTLIIPQKSSQTLYPRANATANVVNNIVSLIGVKAPDTAIVVARTELLAAAIAAIKRKRLDNNTYTVKSYPQVFKSGNTSLSVGQAVTLINGTYTLATHVRKLVTRLDFPEIVEITVGNEKHKGPISTLKEQVSTVVYYGGGGVSAPAGGGSQSETPETTQMADRLTGNTPHRVWGQPYWQNGVPNDVSGSLSDVENILMDGFIEFGSNSRIYEDSDRKLKLRGYNGIEIEHNLFIGTDLAIKTAAVGENGTDLLAYKSGDWGGVTGAHWFVGVAGVDGFIRSDGELKRWANNDNQYTIWDSENLDPTSFLTSDDLTNYAQKNWVGENYLSKSGGIIKGTLEIDDTNDDPVVLISDDGDVTANGDLTLGGTAYVTEDNDLEQVATRTWVTNSGIAGCVTSVAPGAASSPQADSIVVTTPSGTDNFTVPFATRSSKLDVITAQNTSTTGTNYTEILQGTLAFSCDNLLASDTDNVALQVGYSVDKWQISALGGHLYVRQNDDANGRPTEWTAWRQVLDTGNWSTFITQSSLGVTDALAGKQNKIHFLNRNNNNTESDFSYLYLPLRDVNSGYAELDCVPVTGMNSFFLKSQLGVDNYPSRVGHAVGMQSKLNQYGTGDNGVRGGVYFMFGRSSNSSQDVFERININCLAEYKSDDYNSNYGLSITPTALTFLGNTVYHAGNASSSIVTLSDQQTISGAKTFSADVTHSGTSKAKFGSLSSIYENSSNVLVLTGGNGIELNDDTNVGNGYSLTFNDENGIASSIISNSEYLRLWGIEGVVIDDAAYVMENNELWKLATESWVENCIGSAATLTIAQVTSSDQKVVTSGMTFTASNGTYLLKGNSNNNGKIVLRARFTVSEECLVKVTLTASSEQNFDFGVVGLLDDDDLSSNSGSIGNKILAKASGNNTIVTKFVKVSSGDHYFEIGYVKDGSQSTYDDCATIKIEKIRTSFDCLPRSGGTMTGDLNLGVSKLKFQNGHIENTTQDGGYMRLYSASGQFHFHGESAYGTCVAAAFTQQSDARLKEVTKHLTPGIEDIAAAPVVTFRWKDGDGNDNLGSLAQYWQTVFPQAVHEDADGHLSMEYGTIALASAVTAARKVMDLERRVALLESR